MVKRTLEWELFLDRSSQALLTSIIEDKSEPRAVNTKGSDEITMAEDAGVYLNSAFVSFNGHRTGFQPDGPHPWKPRPSWWIGSRRPLFRWGGLWASPRDRRVSPSTCFSCFPAPPRFRSFAFSLSLAKRKIDPVTTYKELTTRLLPWKRGDKECFQSAVRQSSQANSFSTFQKLLPSHIFASRNFSLNASSLGPSISIWSKSIFSPFSSRTSS